ncbi:BCCT family transporter [Roseospira visakhapatnamensis]|uniref:BCCT family betaine/carnitine transporter n=1 Tax=Roseospira visakhapatnamensis TaxID=390880 RepID=A0A7W6REU5_9PROT|nr:BCCT family transporter [Roseospira visakhapatnamensis]MBB4267235.1 BCCT family betaine/carnitine transporter [Roseospira visakhapatnamensis]
MTPPETLYDTDYEVGQDNIQAMGMDIHNPVFGVSAALILMFVVGTLMMPEEAKVAFEGARTWSINTFDWLFLGAGNIFVIFCLMLVVLPVGSVRLGGEDARPDFTLTSWFAMLFAAGMGIGLMFWSVAEPVAYYTGWYHTPLNVLPNTPEATGTAMGATMFHWGLHPWAIYAVVGLSLAFFAYNKGLPLTVRSAFYPLVQDRSWGWFGNTIDVVAVLATIFGLATSLGLGARQAAGGLEFLFGIPADINTQIAIIVAVTSVAVISVVRGLDGGVKVLSNINMVMAIMLLLFVFLTGSTLALVNGLWSTTVAYVQTIVPLSLWFGREDEAFMHGWTVFYWAWWISWSPFVGMFIARVSRGRTVRQFIVAVLLVPTLVTIVWMTVFGGSGLEQVQQGIGALANGLGNDESQAMFQMLASLPLASITSFVAICLVLVFFITSSDSGSLVIDSITAGGKLDAPVPQRIFWAVMEGVIAAVLLFVGGASALKALQAASVTVGLPFTLVLLAMCVTLYLGLSHERKYVIGKG